MKVFVVLSDRFNIRVEAVRSSFSGAMEKAKELGVKSAAEAQWNTSGVLVFPIDEGFVRIEEHEVEG